MSLPSPGTIKFKEILATPTTPDPGYAVLYVKTDNVVYLKDSSGTEIPLGTASGITSLTGEATATGPGAAAVTLSNSAVIGKVLTGFTSGPNSTVLATDTLLQAIQKLQAQVSASSGITNLTGDVSATGPGTVAATVNTVGGSSAANIHSAELAANAATPTNTSSTIVKRDASGNFSAGLITANLSGNATTATTATSFSGSLSGDVTGTQSSTVVATVGGKTASDIASAVSTVDAATSINTASTLVERDASGNFAAGTITANLTGNISGSSASFTGSLSGDVTGTQSATTISSPTVTGKVLTGYTIGSNTPISATDSILVAFEKVQGQLSATSGSALTALTGDVTATGPGSGTATVNSVGGSSASNIHSAELAANAATDVNTPSTIVKRDASGNFNAGVITADLTGNVTGNVSGTAANVTGIVAVANGGTNSSTALNNNRIIKSSGGAIVEAAAITANSALISDTNGIPTQSITTATELSYVSGVTSSIQTQLSGISGSAVTSLTGDVTGTGPGATATTVVTVGGKSASDIAQSVNDTQAATSVDTPSTIVKRDASGNILISQVNGVVPEAHASRHNPGGADALAVATPVQIGTSNFIGAASSYSLSDHIHSHGNQTNGALHAAATGSVNGFMSSTDKTKLDASTNLNTASTLVQRDASGNFAAGTITANLVGSSTTFTGSLSGDVTGTQSATVVSTVGGKTASDVATSVNDTQAATDANTASTIVKRDASGNVSLSTADLSTALILDQTSAPSGVSGKVKIYDQLSNGFDRTRWVDNTGLIVTLHRDSYNVTFNNSGSTINKGQLVYISGQNTGAPTIALAKADTSNTANVYGFAMESIPTANYGRVQFAGVITNIDTSAVTAGSLIYLSAATAGAFTGTAPAIPNFQVIVGTVTTSAVSGIVALTIETAIEQGTSSNTASALVKRDASGNFSAGTITANLTGNASGSAGSFTGSLVGDVTGTQGATVVSTVGGKTASVVATSVNDTIAATSSNTVSTIVKRDSNGDFSMRDLTVRKITQSGAYYSSVFALTDAATITTDASLGNVFTVTLGGNRTLANPTNGVDGQKVTFRIRQDATGSRTLSYGTAFNFPASLAGLSLSTSANAYDYLGCQYNGVTSKWDVLAFTSGL